MTRIALIINIEGQARRKRVEVETVGEDFKAELLMLVSEALGTILDHPVEVVEVKERLSPKRAKKGVGS